MFKNNILNAFVNQSYPIKCQILNSILEESTSKVYFFTKINIINHLLLLFFKGIVLKF